MSGELNHFLYIYFDIRVTQDYVARFRRNRFTRSVDVWQLNCTDDNHWDAPGYGWGRWQRV